MKIDLALRQNFLSFYTPQWYMRRLFMFKHHYNRSGVTVCMMNGCDEPNGMFQ